MVAGRVAVIRFVLEHLEHYDLRSVDGRGWSLLHAAAHHGHRDATQLLLDASCDTAATDLVSTYYRHYKQTLDTTGYHGTPGRQL